MRRILTAASLVLLCAGCGSRAADDVASTGSVCAARITWDGAVYFGQAFPSLPPGTLTLGTGGRPTCADRNGGEAGASSTVEVRKLSGVDPRVAVGVRGERDRAYLAAGYFLQLPAHPLHRALEWSPRSLNELTGCAKSPPMTIEGTVRYGPSAVLDVSRRDDVARGYVGDEALLFVDAHTKVEGDRRGGLPYIAPGTLVSVRAVACLARDGRLRELVPRLISPA